MTDIPYENIDDTDLFNDHQLKPPSIFEML